MSNPQVEQANVTARNPLDEANSKDKNRRSIVSDSISFGIVFALALTMIQRIVGFGRGVLFCRALPEDELGQWSMVYSFLLLLAPLSVMGLPGSFGRYLERYRQRRQMGIYVSRMTWVSGIGTASLIAAMLILPNRFSSVIFGQTGVERLVYAMAFGLACVAAFNFLTSLLEGLRQVRLVTVMRFVMAIAFATLGLVFAFTWSNGAMAVTVAFAVANLIGIVPALFFLVRHRGEFADDGEGFQHRQMWKQIVPFATWMWLINFVTNAYEVADRVMLTHLNTGTAEMAQSAIGQYHSGRILPMMLVGVAAMIAGFLMPYMSAAWESGKFDEAKSLMRWTVKIVAIGFTGVATLMLAGAPIIFDWILQGRYDDGLAVLPLTLVYCIWYSMISVSQDYLWCREQGKLALSAVAVGLFINVFANWAAIPVWGLHGAVAATAISNLCCLVVLMGFNQKLGWQVDRGILIVIVIPCIALLPVLYSLAASVLVAIGCLRYEWVFTNSEKQQISQHLNERLRSTRLEFLAKCLSRKALAAGETIETGV